MLESKDKSVQGQFTTDSFDTELKMLVLGFQSRLNKATTFFQGLFAGMALLYTITLNLSPSVSKDLIRVEDQAIRIVLLLSTFGALYSLMFAWQKYEFTKANGTGTEIDNANKCLLLCSIEIVGITIKLFSILVELHSV